MMLLLISLYPSLRLSICLSIPHYLSLSLSICLFISIHPLISLSPRLSKHDRAPKTFDCHTELNTLWRHQNRLIVIDRHSFVKWAWCKPWFTLYTMEESKLLSKKDTWSWEYIYSATWIIKQNKEHSTHSQKSLHWGTFILLSFPFSNNFFF